MLVTMKTALSKVARRLVFECAVSESKINARASDQRKATLFCA